MIDERMQAIFGLDVTKKFVLELFKFVSSFSILEERLRNELAAKDHSACFKTMMDICIGLKKIYAGDLADGFYQQVQMLKSKEHEEIEMYLAEFLVYASMLAMDIQMALFKHDSDQVSRQVHLINDTPASKLQVEPEHLLAIDDTMLFLITLRSYFKDTGFRLTSCTSKDDAVEFLTKHRPALIFTDVDLPKMDIDGFELAAKIREMGHDAPIVFLTGNASEKNVLKSMEMGAAGFFVKPASQNSIMQLLEKLIGIPEKPSEEALKKPRFNTKDLPDHLTELNDLPQ